jgi:hypothetical protein
MGQSGFGAQNSAKTSGLFDFSAPKAVVYIFLHLQTGCFMLY